MKTLLRALILFLSLSSLQVSLAGEEKSVVESTFTKEILEREVSCEESRHTKTEYVYVSASKTDTIYIKHHYSNTYYKRSNNGTQAFTAVVYELKKGETITINSELDDEQYSITYLNDGAIRGTFKLKIEKSKLPK